MKKLGIILAITTVAVFIFAYIATGGDLSKSYLASPCSTPLPYKLGSVDARFEITNEEALAHIDEASKIWENSINKDIFVEDPDARLTISFVYDQRQALNSQIRDLQEELDSENASLAQKVELHKLRVSEFQQKVETLRDEIRSWNEKGGAPSEVYNDLVTRQNQLKEEADQLNTQAQDLDITAENYNLKVDELNDDVSEFNQAISAKPEEGLYDPNNETISIYFVNDRDELVHTLAHELGHAIAMDHVEDEDSIMFAKTNSIITPSNIDLTQLTEACEEKFIATIWAEKMARWLRFNYLKLGSTLQN